MGAVRESREREKNMEGQRYEWKGRWREGGLNIRIFVVVCSQKL